MKLTSTICIVLPLLLQAKAPSAESMAFYNATQHGADVMEHVRVVDQDGNPVEKARMWGGLRFGDRDDEIMIYEGFTNTNGEYTVKGKCRDRFSLSVTKDDYYDSYYWFSYWNTKSQPKVVDGKWQPYGGHHTVVLNKIVNPQRLCYHRAYVYRKIPVYNQWIGFDFEKGDYVSPYGQGVENDILLRYFSQSLAEEELHETLEISFTNSPYAGAYVMDKSKTSEFQSVYNADTNAVYQKTFVYRYDHVPSKKIIGRWQRLTEDQYLVFRVRTKVDEEGRLVSANYGKTYGDLHFTFGKMRLGQLFFNPTPNDTNLEDLKTAETSRRMQRQRKRIQKRREREQQRSRHH